MSALASAPLSCLQAAVPVISVLVIATRSRASMVSATLRSLEEQSLTAWQLVLGRLDLSEVETAALVPDDRRDGRIVLAPKGGATLGAALRRAADVPRAIS